MLKGELLGFLRSVKPINAAAFRLKLHPELDKMTASLKVLRDLQMQGVDVGDI